MLRRLIVLDVALVALLVMGGMKVKKDWKAFWPAHDVAAIQPKPHTYPPIAASGPSVASAVVDWTEIPTRDPFSFDRNDVDIVIAVPVEAPPPKPQGPKPILFGTFTLGNESTALVAAGTPGNKNLNSKPMKVGESIDGWTILSIGPKSMQVESGATKLTVITNDPTNAPPREIVKTVAPPAPVVVQTIGVPAPVTSSGVVAAPAPSAASSAPRPAPTDPGAGMPPPPDGMKYSNTPFGPMLVKDSK